MPNLCTQKVCLKRWAFNGSGGPSSHNTQALLGIVYSGDWLAFIKEACVPVISLLP